jgi:hypothetical protein
VTDLEAFVEFFVKMGISPRTTDTCPPKIVPVEGVLCVEIGGALFAFDRQNRFLGVSDGEDWYPREQRVDAGDPGE